MRYYEKIGLIRNVRRDSSGYRDYSDDDVQWLEFIERLKSTGMPLKEMGEFADYRYRGDATIAERLAILTKHRSKIESEQQKLTDNLGKIIKKIDYYEEKLKTFKKHLP